MAVTSTASRLHRARQLGRRSGTPIQNGGRHDDSSKKRKQTRLVKTCFKDCAHLVSGELAQW